MYREQSSREQIQLGRRGKNAKEFAEYKQIFGLCLAEALKFLKKNILKDIKNAIFR